MRVMAETNHPLFEVWRRQFEEGAQAWIRLLGQPAGAMRDPTLFWRPFIEQWGQLWGGVLGQAPMNPDLPKQWKEFFDQSIEAWARVLGQAMQTEAFAQWFGRYVEQLLVTSGPLKKAVDRWVETGLEAMNMASRTQLTAVAKQIVELDERVERLEDGVRAILMRLDDLGRRLGRRESDAVLRREQG
jgi:hypothetical protein